MKKRHEMNRTERLYEETDNLPEEEWADDTAFDWFSLGVKMADNNPNWISSDDSLPGEDGPYLVSDGEIVLYDYFIKGSWMSHELNEKVIYWMSLPNIPKKEKLSYTKEKELFKELCYRLPYNTIVNIKDKNTGKSFDKVLDALCISSYGAALSQEIRPYLFPMSSMTKEQEKEFEEVNLYDSPYNLQGIEWLLEHHFDFRDMVSQGLAIPATKEIYEKN